MTMLGDVKMDMRRLADPERARLLQRFFKTGKGEYAEGDIFLGLTVPQTRILVKKYRDIAFKDIRGLVRSPVHEERLLGLLMLVWKFEHGDSKIRDEIFRFYLDNTASINNWDLVDLTAGRIVGPSLDNRGMSVLRKLAASSSLWERRIAIISTFYFITKGVSDHTLAIAEMLIGDEHDLIHKAVGWMLREVGKRINTAEEEAFLRLHYKKMPRTMLRYAIERFPEKKRLAYLKK